MTRPDQRTRPDRQTCGPVWSVRPDQTKTATGPDQRTRPADQTGGADELRTGPDQTDRPTSRFTQAHQTTPNQTRPERLRHGKAAVNFTRELHSSQTANASADQHEPSPIPYAGPVNFTARTDHEQGTPK